MKAMKAAIFLLIFLHSAILCAQTLTESEPEDYQTLDTLFGLYQPYLGNISAYKPIYFLVGVNPEESKFQISFKYRFFNPEGPLAENHPWINGFNIAYTQTSFWDLKSDSKPFEDTSYKPEIFYLSSNIGGFMPDYGRFFIQTGFRHESNGKGGDESRSTNYLYAEPSFVFFHEPSRLGFQIYPRLWTYVFNDSDSNPDLDEYRGYFELGMKVGKADSWVFESNLMWAKKGESIRLDFTYPLHRRLVSDLQLYLHAQYSNSLAESLINYQDRTQAIRIGFSIVR